MARYYQKGTLSKLYLYKGFIFVTLVLCLIAIPASGVIEPNEVLILVNDNSHTSRYIAKLYCQYYQEIPELQVLYLSGLTDCSGPSSTAADEIITRDQYDELIAEPVRDYLIDNGLVNKIKVIATTAGLPYRIEDMYSYFANVVRPGGSTPYLFDYIAYVSAASVESELAVLFQTEPSIPIPSLLFPFDRAVNAYQGYRNSGINLFERDILNNIENLHWQHPRVLYIGHQPPFVEGEELTQEGIRDRDFSAGDMYLTCRLDGPKEQGQSAVFSVHKMLERSKRASSTQYGINPSEAVAIFDDAPGVSNINSNRIYNLNVAVDYIIWQQGTQQPPNTGYAETRDDYNSGFKQATGQTVVADQLNVGQMNAGYDLTVICDKRPNHRTNQDDLDPNRLCSVIASYGTNGDESSASDYMKTEGPNDGPLFNLAYGAVMASVESLSAVTMFSDVTTSPAAQGKIVDFLEIGGCGAIGHSFEPYSDASIDTEFLVYNMLADFDEDGFADVTFVEAAFTAIPYLSWSEVTIGDPLMRIAYGPGGSADELLDADFNNDGTIDIADLIVFAEAYLGCLHSADDTLFDRYNDVCDLDHDGTVNIKDFACFASAYYVNP
ncbi:MAG: hypothetical protein PVG93_02495 [Phycisphaerales bacterium]|jgi:hypothetical protein